MHAIIISTDCERPRGRRRLLNARNKNSPSSFASTSGMVPVGLAAKNPREADDARRCGRPQSSWRSRATAAAACCGVPEFPDQRRREKRRGRALGDGPAHERRLLRPAPGRASTDARRARGRRVRAGRASLFACPRGPCRRAHMLPKMPRASGVALCRALASHASIACTHAMADGWLWCGPWPQM